MPRGLQERMVEAITTGNDDKLHDHDSIEHKQFNSNPHCEDSG